MNKQNYKIAVLIPCYNEGITIRKVVSDWKKQLPTADIYVYDNNSTDNTVEEALKAGAIIKKETLQGKGNVIRRMFQEIDAHCYIMVDGDDTYSPQKANEMVSLVIDDNVDMVIGDRLSSTYFTENKKIFNSLGNLMVRKLVNIFFNNNVKDIMTGCRAFSYRFVKTFPVLSKGFEIETEMTIHAVTKNFNIRNVIIEYKDRPAGSVSKLNTLTDGFKVIKTIFKLLMQYRPLLLFSFLGILFLLPCVVLLCSGVNSLTSQTITLLLGATGILSIFTGIILSSLHHKQCQEFENKLHLWRSYEK